MNSERLQRIISCINHITKAIKMATNSELTDADANWELYCAYTKLEKSIDFDRIDNNA